jgi:hypothetical protein
MPDPLTLLGAAAAGEQIVELAATALLKTIRLAKDLRDVPKKMAVLLQDVENSTTRIHYLFTVDLQPGSKVFEQLDASQFDNLSRAATELRQAMDDVNIILKPLVGTQQSGKGNTAQRLWRSIMTVKAEKDAIEKLGRVDRLNNEVNRQLGVTLLELQATVSDKLDRANIAAGNNKVELVGTVETNSRKLQLAVHERHVATTTHLTSISSTTRDVDRTVTEVRGKVTAIDIDMRRVAEDTTFIRHQVAALAEAKRPAPVSYQQMQDLNSRLASRADILQLRDDMLSLMTRQSSELSPASQMTSQNLNKLDRRALQESARLQLLRSPSSLADATAGLRPGGPPITRPCQCRVSRQYKGTRLWGLSLRSEKVNEHRPGCAYAKSGSQSWSYSARAALTPFLNVTLELAIGAMTGPGSWSMTSPLKFYGTVRRSQSPLFQAFDRIYSLCLKKRVVLKSEAGDLDTPHCRFFSSEKVKSYLSDFNTGDQKDHYFYTEWDLDALRNLLDDLCRRLPLEIANGHASGTDSDEQGQTLLFVSSSPLGAKSR